jgi:pilus assembly protein CpaB
MNRRLIGIAGAIVLAALGTVALVTYVQSAHDEAAAQEAMVDVWIVKSTIEQGTPAEDIEQSVQRTQAPGRLVADDAVTGLDTLTGLVADAEMLPGEQLVRTRFVTPTEARTGDLPPGMLEVTVELEPERALGGQLRAGDTVAVLLSFEPFDYEGVVVDGSGNPTKLTGKTPNTTHIEVHKVLVTAVQIVENATGVPTVPGDDEDEPDEGVVSAPSDNLFVTLALDARALEQVVFAAEFGTVWLANEPLDASEAGTRIVDRGNVYDSIPLP